jgi:hypothetical protein
VLLRGEAGIGKTAVVQRFCEEQRASSRILWGACESLFTSRPLAPFVDISELTGGALGGLVERGGRPHEVLSTLSDEVWRSSPTILVLEDVHWADEATLDVLRLLSRRIDGFRALVLATYRDDELDSSRLLRVVLGELARTPGVERLDIARLSEAAVAELAQTCEIDADAVYRTTGGNAFFVSEVLAAGTAQIPSTVRDAVLARAVGLSAGASALLGAVAIAPPSAALAVLEVIAGAALGCLQECIGRGMLVQAGRGVVFRHELARLVIEESVAPDRRLVLHARALQALADSRPPRPGARSGSLASGEVASSARSAWARSPAGPIRWSGSHTRPPRPRRARGRCGRGPPGEILDERRHLVMAHRLARWAKPNEIRNPPARPATMRRPVKRRSSTTSRRSRES